jgi:hypothetical protein
MAEFPLALHSSVSICLGCIWTYVPPPNEHPHWIYALCNGIQLNFHFTSVWYQIRTLLIWCLVSQVIVELKQCLWQDRFCLMCLWLLRFLLPVSWDLVSVCNMVLMSLHWYLMNTCFFRWMFYIPLWYPNRGGNEYSEHSACSKTVHEDSTWFREW